METTSPQVTTTLTRTAPPPSPGEDAPLRAAIYVRISKDRTGAGLGVARQEEDCAALCRARGWQIVRVYVDNDVSASSGKPRPAWKELLADIKAGRVDAIVCWHVDRLTRSPVS
jgi:site-specific DNA recombinase